MAPALGLGVVPGAWAVLKVVSGVAGLAALALEHVGDGRGLEHAARRGAGLGEDPLGVLAERPVEQLDDLQHGYLRGVTREAVAALDAALRGDYSGATQDREELLEELRRDLPLAGELTERNRLLAAAGRELAESRERIWGL